MAGPGETDQLDNLLLKNLLARELDSKVCTQAGVYLSIDLMVMAAHDDSPSRTLIIFPAWR